MQLLGFVSIIACAYLAVESATVPTAGDDRRTLQLSSSVGSGSTGKNQNGPVVANDKSPVQSSEGNSGKKDLHPNTQPQNNKPATSDSKQNQGKSDVKTPTGNRPPHQEKDAGSEGQDDNSNSQSKEDYHKNQKPTPGSKPKQPTTTDKINQGKQAVGDKNGKSKDDQAKNTAGGKDKPVTFEHKPNTEHPSQEKPAVGGKEGQHNQDNKPIEGSASQGNPTDVDHGNEHGPSGASSSGKTQDAPKTPTKINKGGAPAPPASSSGKTQDAPKTPTKFNKGGAPAPPKPENDKTSTGKGIAIGEPIKSTAPIGNNKPGNNEPQKDKPISLPSKSIFSNFPTRADQPIVDPTGGNKDQQKNSAGQKKPEESRNTGPNIFHALAPSAATSDKQSDKNENKVHS